MGKAAGEGMFSMYHQNTVCIVWISCVVNFAEGFEIVIHAHDTLLNGCQNPSILIQSPVMLDTV